MSARRRRERRMVMLALVNIAVIIAAIAGVLYAMRVLRPAEYDPNTLCVYAEELPPHTAIVLDKTDEYTEVQSDLIAQLIRRTRELLDVGERITVFELDARGQFDPRGRFSLCNPGRGDQVNPLISNPRMIEERYAEMFEGPFEEVIDDLVEPKEAPQSPILEALARLAQTEAFSRDAPEREVLLVSDMLQNSDAFTAYGGGGALPRGTPDAADIADAIVRRHGTGLRGVEVEIRLIPRDGYADLQRGALRELWDDVFDELGVRARWRDL